MVFRKLWRSSACLSVFGKAHKTSSLKKQRYLGEVQAHETRAKIGKSAWSFSSSLACLSWTQRSFSSEGAEPHSSLYFCQSVVYMQELSGRCKILAASTYCRTLALLLEAGTSTGAHSPCECSSTGVKPAWTGKMALLSSVLQSLPLFSRDMGHPACCRSPTWHFVDVKRAVPS